jgi:glyoxylate reductase
VLTEATAEFAFFMMGALARKMWAAEHLTRELKWGYWHPYLPFLGDEVTGKTVAVIGTGTDWAGVHQEMCWVRYERPVLRPGV